MTEKEWRALKAGDSIVSKRSPGIILEVLDRDGRGLKVKAPHGEFWLGADAHTNRWLNYQQRFPQAKLSL